MRISVIVPAFNEEKLLAGTLRQIKSAAQVLAFRGWELELVVCDNNSTDHTAEVAQAEGAKVVFEPINQIARARNTGAQAATGDWLVFVDADSQPSRELVGAMAEQIQGGVCLAGGSTIRMSTHDFAARAVVALWNWISRLRRLLAGSFIFCEAAAFREIGGFSENLYAGEEIDLSQRLKSLARQRGRKLVILHRHPLTTSNRKLHLYTPLEHGRFICRAIFSRGGTLKHRDGCTLWYDGRR